MKIKKHIPNTITLMNLLCGVLAIIELLSFDNVATAALLVILAAIFDFFDGMTARLLKISSPIGKELDSLSDVVSFGVVPSLIAYYYIRVSEIQYCEILCFVPLLMALMSSYRLAKFNLDTRQTTSFIGLPTPANALLWISLPLVQYANNHGFYSLIPTFSETIMNNLISPWFILPMSLFMSILLVSEIGMFSLKFHSLKWAENKLRFIFLALCVLLAVAFNLTAIPLILLLYIMISVIFFTPKKN